MPTYEYRCERCGTTVEAVQSFADDPLTTCETCGGPLRKVYAPVGIVFKGSGFYKTDSRTSRPGAKAGSGAASADATASSDGGGSKDGASKDGASSDGSKVGSKDATPARDASKPADGAAAGRAPATPKPAKTGGSSAP